MRITLPLPPNMANARMHWRTKNRKRQDYELRCDTYPNPEPEPFVGRAVIKAHLVTWSTMDGDNLMARMKWPVDWLVKRGYLVDDSPTYLVWVMPTQEIGRKNRRIEITLEAL